MAEGPPPSPPLALPVAPETVEAMARLRPPSSPVRPERVGEAAGAVPGRCLRRLVAVIVVVIVMESNIPAPPPPTSGTCSVSFASKPNWFLSVRCQGGRADVSRGSSSINVPVSRLISRSIVRAPALVFPFVAGDEVCATRIGVREDDDGELDFPGWALAAGKGKIASLANREQTHGSMAFSTLSITFWTYQPRESQRIGGHAG